MHVSPSSPPAITYFALNDNETHTNSLNVTLNNTCTNYPTHYMASEDPGFGSAQWIEYPQSSPPTFPLDPGSGTGIRTVYFKVKNYVDESSVQQDSIDYGDLEITNLEFIQVVRNPDKGVCNKPTVARVTVNSTYATEINKFMSITGNFNEGSNMEKGIDELGIPFNNGINEVYLPGGPIYYNNDYVELSGSLKRLIWENEVLADISATLLNVQKRYSFDNKVESLSTTLNYFKSGDLNVLVVPVYFPDATMHDWDTNKEYDVSQQPKYLNENEVGNEIDFMTRVYPVPSEGIKYECTEPIPWTDHFDFCTGQVPGFTGDFGFFYTSMKLYLTVGLTYTLIAKLGGYDRVVIAIDSILYGNLIGYEFPDGIFNPTSWVGMAPGMLYEGVLPDCDVNNIPVFIVASEIHLEPGNLDDPTLIAHEIGHTFYLQHPHGNAGPANYVDMKYDADNADYYKLARTLMSYESNPPPGGGQWTENPVWIDWMRYCGDQKQKIVDETIWNLMDQFLVMPKDNNERSEEVIVISGILHDSIEVTIDDPWYKSILTEPDLMPYDGEQFKAVLLDSQNHVLEEYGFTLEFTVKAPYNNDFITVDVESVPFIFSVLFESGTKKIEIRTSSDEVLVSRSVSDNEPMVDLIAPNGGEVYETGDLIDIVYYATDVDGDDLEFTLFYSSLESPVFCV